MSAFRHSSRENSEAFSKKTEDLKRIRENKKTADLKRIRENRKTEDKKEAEETAMEEVFPGIYRIKMIQKLDSEIHGTHSVYVYLVPGEDRSLLIDTGYNHGSCLEILIDAMDSLGMKTDKLDVFLTHQHADHSGLAGRLEALGAVIHMNPDEEVHHYDCVALKYGAGSKEAQQRVLRSTGVTPERTPDTIAEFRSFDKAVKSHYAKYYKIPDFTFQPVHPGDLIRTGSFQFRAISLKGHTYGQLGLVEEEKQILFPADQLMRGVSPVVSTAAKDEHLLQCLLDSVGELADLYQGWHVFPMHGKNITDLKEAADAIIHSYQNKLRDIKAILDSEGKPMTVFETMLALYHIRKIPENVNDFYNFKLMLTKTFSMLECLYDQGIAEREDEDGMLWYSL